MCTLRFIIKDYFLNFKERNSNFTINTKKGDVKFLDEVSNNWNVTLVNTGIDSMTGGRVKRIKEYIKEEDDFFLTYGDGLCNVNLDELIKFHKSHQKIATVTAVRPNARFGELVIDNDSVKSFKEKPQTDKGRINGGFFVFNKRVFDFIDNDKTVRNTIKMIHKEEGKDYNLMFGNGGDQDNSSIPETKMCESLGIKLVDGLGTKIQSSSWLLNKQK